MKKILIVLLCVVLGCSNCAANKPCEPENAPDYFVAFYEKLYATSLADVPKESLPEWLVFKLNELENEYGDQLNRILARIHKGEWKNRTVYFVSRPFNSCLLCEVFDDEGKQLVWASDDPEIVNFCTTSKNWTIVYEFGEALDVYDYLIDWDSEEWFWLMVDEKEALLQIPDAILAVIFTEGLLETCLANKFLSDLAFSNIDNFQKGFDRFVARFNSFSELLNRPDLTAVLLKKYKRMTIELWESITEGRYYTLLFAVEMLLAQDAVLKNLSGEQEQQLILLSFEHKEIKQKYSFTNVSDVPANLLYAKMMMNDPDVRFESEEQRKALAEFIQKPVVIDQRTFSFVEEYMNNKYK